MSFHLGLWFAGRRQQGIECREQWHDQHQPLFSLPQCSNNLCKKLPIDTVVIALIIGAARKLAETQGCSRTSALPTTYPQPAIAGTEVALMTLICSSCRAEVARANCHCNRYGEMICHACKRAGVNFTWRRRLLAIYKRTPLYVAVCLLSITAMSLFTWLVYLIALSGLPRFFY